MIESKSVRELIDDEYREYSMYVLEHRAIPSAIDGLKPVHRKLLYSMIKNGGASKKIKCAEIGGSLSAYGYAHGESSAQASAVGMAQEWNNNAPLFKGHGNFGSRIVPEAAAPRYIYVSLSDNYKKFFCDSVVSPQNEDPEHPEPHHYLPIIPWVLVNGIKGIAVGFATTILPRSTDSLVKASIKYLEGKKIPELKPTFPDFKGEVVKTSPDSYSIVGIVSNDKLEYHITELPVGFSREGYVDVLEKLIDDNKIQDYDDFCSGEGFNFKVKVNRAQKANIEKRGAVNFFKLSRSFTENITTVDEKGSLKLFRTPQEVLEYFCNYRTTMFEKKRQYDLKELEGDIRYLTDRVRFSNAVLDGEVDLRSTTKEQLLRFIHDKITQEEYGKKFVNIPLYDMTMDSIKSTEKKINELKQILDRLSKTTAEEIYLEKLKGVL